MVNNSSLPGGVGATPGDNGGIPARDVLRLPLFRQLSCIVPVNPFRRDCRLWHATAGDIPLTHALPCRGMNNVYTERQHPETSSIPFPPLRALDARVPPSGSPLPAKLIIYRGVAVRIITIGTIAESAVAHTHRFPIDPIRQQGIRSLRPIHAPMQHVT